MLMTNKQFQDWISSGAIITKEEYSILQTIVEESLNRLAESRLRGSKEFNKSLEEEIDIRHNLMEKLRYYVDVKNAKEN